LHFLLNDPRSDHLCIPRGPVVSRAKLELKILISLEHYIVNQSHILHFVPAWWPSGFPLCCFPVVVDASHWLLCEWFGVVAPLAVCFCVMCEAITDDSTEQKLANTCTHSESLVGVHRVKASFNRPLDSTGLPCREIAS
jgi:hypothetical protein